MSTTLSSDLGPQLWSLACDAWWDLFCDAWFDIGEQVEAGGDLNELRQACGVRLSDNNGMDVWSEIDRKVGETS